MTYCIVKVKCTLNAGHKSTDFAIMITTANTRGFGAFLRKYTYNKYIYIYYICYIISFVCIFIINAGNSLCVMYCDTRTGVHIHTQTHT